MTYEGMEVKTKKFSVSFFRLPAKCCVRSITCRNDVLMYQRIFYGDLAESCKYKICCISAKFSITAVKKLIWVIFLEVFAYCEKAFSVIS